MWLGVRVYGCASFVKRKKKYSVNGRYKESAKQKIRALATQFNL